MPYFDANYRSMTGLKGSVILFNSYLWHRGGFNYDRSQQGCAELWVSACLSSKPQLDYARMLAGVRIGREPAYRQILGYNSMTPTSLAEWYQPELTRLYKSNQG